MLAVPNFATGFNISQAIAGVSERALIVLPMALLIIAREIDLSVASMLALTSVVFGVARPGRRAAAARHRRRLADRAPWPAPSTACWSPRSACRRWS